MNGLFSNLLKKKTQLSANKIEFECIKLSIVLMLSMMAKVDSLSSSQEYSVPLAELRKTTVESIQNFLKDWLATEIGGRKFGGDFSTGWFKFSSHACQPKLSQEVEVSMIVLHVCMHYAYHNCCSVCRVQLWNGLLVLECASSVKRDLHEVVEVVVTERAGSLTREECVECFCDLEELGNTPALITNIFMTKTATALDDLVFKVQIIKYMHCMYACELYFFCKLPISVFLII